MLQKFSNPRHTRTGFSFAEVLFAVAVLGIGFIMIAAVFPVAIQQTQTTLEESVGTSVTHNGVGYLSGSIYMTSTGLPFTAVPVAAPAIPNPGRVFSFRDPRIAPAAAPGIPTTADQLWLSVKKNLIVPNDPSYAYVGMFQRDNGSNFAKLIVIGVRVRNRSKFEVVADGDRKPVPATSDTVAELEPRPVKVRLIDGGTTAPDRVQIENLTVAADDPNAKLRALSATSDGKGAAAEGAYVIISDDKVADDATTPFTNESGRANGRVYRLGPETNTPAPPAGWSQFELAAGDDMESNLENLPGLTTGSTDAVAFLVGRGYADPATPANGHSGVAQSIKHYINLVALP